MSSRTLPILPSGTVPGKDVPRKDGRKSTEMRDLRIEVNPLRYAEGSAMVYLGNTQILCAASVEDGVPSFLRNSGEGWVTAEYAMLPRSTHARSDRRRQLDASRSKEIQRLIGRSLRSVCDRTLFPDKQVKLDCDVIQADGGTRSASVIGAYVALAIGFLRLKKYGVINDFPLTAAVAALSCGVVGGEILCDLCYEEDAAAAVDANFVLSSGGEGGGEGGREGDIIELQATGEKASFSDEDFAFMLGMARQRIAEIFVIQEQAIAAFR